MQPVQLSLIPDPTLAPPAPAPPAPASGLPAEAVAVAITLLAGVIAKAAAPSGREATSGE